MSRRMPGIVTVCANGLLKTVHHHWHLRTSLLGPPAAPKATAQVSLVAKQKFGVAAVEKEDVAVAVVVAKRFADAAVKEVVVVVVSVEQDFAAAEAEVLGEYQL